MIGNNMNERFKSKKERCSDFQTVDHTDIYGNRVRITGASINDYWARFARCKQVYETCVETVGFETNTGEIEITKTAHGVNIKTSGLGTIHSYALDVDEWYIFEQVFLGKLIISIEENSCQ